MSKRLLVFPAALLILLTAYSGAYAVNPLAFAKKSLAYVKYPFRSKPPYPSPLSRPEAPMPNPDVLIPPAGETKFFPMRSDGQAYFLNIDNTVNVTDALNHCYFDPHFRAEVWGPYSNTFIVERMVTLCQLWPDYDEFSILRRMNNWHKFWEKYSGYGP
jgi:hypothetical protein